MRRAVVALVLTAVAVVLLARYETTPPVTRSADDPRKPPAIPSPAPAPEGSVSAVGPALVTPFSAIQVKASVKDGRLVGVETVALSGDGPHTDALNARAEPILRERALARRERRRRRGDRRDLDLGDLDRVAAGCDPEGAPCRLST